jgi:phage-related protein
MEKRYEVFLAPEAQAFYDNLKEKEKRKMDFIIEKVELNLFGNWFKKLKGSNEIWEFVVNYSGLFYRFLAFFDTSDFENPLIIATHGFKKKTNKTPKKEIEKAEQIRSIYFNDIK